VTHRFHPLSGQSFEFVKRLRTWQSDVVYFLDAAGELEGDFVGLDEVEVNVGPAARKHPVLKLRVRQDRHFVPSIRQRRGPHPAIADFAAVARGALKRGDQNLHGDTILVACSP